MKVELRENYPRHWDLKELGDFCEVRSGGTPSRAQQHYFKGEIAWVKIGDMANWIITNTEEKISKVALENSSAKVFPAGTVLISIFATIGSVSILGVEAATNQAIAGITPEPKVADNQYLAYFLMSLKPKIEAMSRGVAQQNINQTILKSVKVPLPPLDEQHAIAGILNRLRNLKEKREQANQLTDKILQSLFLKMFGDGQRIIKTWEWHTIEDCMQNIIDYRGKTPPKTSSGIPLITAKIVKNGKILPPDEFISPNFYDKWMVRGLPLYGDVLFTSEAPLGNVAQLKLRDKIALAQRIILLRGKAKVIDNRFLVYVLLNPTVRHNVQSRATGSTVKGIRQAELRKVRIPVPPFELQEKFAQISEKIESVKQNQLQSTQEITKLFNSLMHKAFRGELRIAQERESKTLVESKLKRQTLLRYME